MTIRHLWLALLCVLVVPTRAESEMTAEVTRLRLFQDYVPAVALEVDDLERLLTRTPVDTAGVLGALNNISQISLESADHFAVRLSAEAATGMASIASADHTKEKAAAALWLGLLDRRELDRKLAAERLGSARALLETVPGAHREWGHLLQAEANLARTMRGSKAALPLYRRALEYRLQHLPRPDFDIADNLVWLAWNLNEAGQDEEAILRAEEAVSELRALGLENHTLMTTLLGMKSDRAALRGDLDTCRALSEREVEIQSNARPGFPFGYARATACPPRAHYKLVWARLEMGEFEGTFELLDRARGTMTGEFAALRAWLRGEGRDHRPQLESLFARLVRAMADNDRAQDASARLGSATRALKAWVEIQEFLQRWEVEFPRRVVDEERARECLEPGQALVVLSGLSLGGHNHERETVRRVDRWAAVVRSDRETTWLKTFSRTGDEIRAHMGLDNRLRAARLRALEWPTRLEFDPELHQLLLQQSNRFLGPVLPHLEGIETAIWVGAETDLRFLYSGSGPMNAVTVPSAGMFVRLIESRRSGPARNKVVAIGAVGSSEEPRLRFVETELQTISRLMPDATVVPESEATEAYFEEMHREGQLDDLSLLHLACHARLGPSAQRDALVLNDAGEPGMGLLEAGELLFHYGIDPELVVLSGCSTAQGRTRSHREVHSLTQTLLGSGVQRVVASRWDVDDEASALFMQRFYENFSGNFEGERQGVAGRSLSVAAAVSEAARWLRNYRDAEGNQPFAHPIYWGGFGVYGLP